MSNAQERQRRWRLVLGAQANDELAIAECDSGMDQALAVLYENAPLETSRQGGLGKSTPAITRWLGDIRRYFPRSVVQVLQRDAAKKLGLAAMLSDPELMQHIEPDLQMVSQILAFSDTLPEETRDSAKQLVRQIVEEVQQRLAQPLRQAVSGSLDRAARNRRPRHQEIDWARTIRANLRHYQAEYRTIIPETRIGYGRKQRAVHDMVLCIDQSGSMITSAVYASLFGAVMASLPALSTQLVLFDTRVVDLSDQLQQDPVDLLFSLKLGGGTDINLALNYCQQRIERPEQTTLILISDLYEGGNQERMRRTAQAIIASGVQCIVLLALDDQGHPSFDHGNAEFFAANGVPAFACTPDCFPDLIAAALQHQDLGLWAAQHGFVTAAPVRA